ncbi:hypothetical protein ACLD54_06475, partial [Gardnerella vaginalis]
CPGGECAENRFDYRKTLVLQCVRHDFLHTFWPITPYSCSAIVLDLRRVVIQTHYMEGPRSRGLSALTSSPP